MRIRMLISVRETGKFFEAGKSYDLNRDAAIGWIRLGFAEEDKMIEAAPEMKDSPDAALAPQARGRRKA